MDEQTFWDKQHDKYLTTDWIDKPSLFAEWAITYFPGSGSLLDLGAGQGQDSRYFAAKGFEVTSTDLSAHAIELAERKSTAGITFKQVDMSHLLPFENQTYDVVYAHLSLHYFDIVTTKKLFEEIHRVLKPQGIFAALFNTTQDQEILEGTELESNYLLLDGLRKRYFSQDSAREFAKEFKILVADDQGTTYKDMAKGNTNLIRLVAKKS